MQEPYFYWPVTLYDQNEAGAPLLRHHVAMLEGCPPTHWSQVSAARPLLPGSNDKHRRESYLVAFTI